MIRRPQSGFAKCHHRHLKCRHCNKACGPLAAIIEYEQESRRLAVNEMGSGAECEFRFGEDVWFQGA
jgi:hypothetical protein